MSSNNLEINESYKILEGILKETSDSKVPITDGDMQTYIKTINERLEEIQNSISKLEQENKEIEEKKSNLDKKLDENDDEKSETDRKIKRLEDQIAEEKIDREDKNNPIVKRLNSALEERNALDEITKMFQENDKDLENQKESNDNSIKSLENEITVLNTTKDKINTIRLKSRVSEASNRAQEYAKHNTSHERDPFIVLLDSLFKRYENIAFRDKILKEAVNNESSTQNKLEAKYSISETTGETSIIEKLKDKNNGLPDSLALSVIIDDRTNNTTQVKILTAEEYADFSNTKEFADIKNGMKEEKGKQDNDKKITYVVSTHDSKNELLKKLEPIMNKATENPQDIGQYATSQSRRNKLIEAIAEDAINSEKLGGTSLDNHFHFASKIEESISTPTAMAQEQQPNLKIQSAELSEQKPQKIDSQDIPWEQLKSFNLNKETLSQENINALINGGATNLITLTGKNKKGLEVKQTFKLQIVNDLDGKLTFEKIPVKPTNNVDYRKTIGDIEFTKEDKEMLKKYGQLNHLVPFTSEDGKTKNMMVGLDKDTNTLFKCDPDKVRLPKFIMEQCTKDELRRIRNCEPVHLKNLKDNAGQAFNGWVVMSPHNDGKILHLKTIDKEFIPQVRNNNFGERTEELKEDKDAMVMTKQTKSNDGEPKIETSHRKAHDFSIDSNGDKWEHDKTIKTTKIK